ncbi:hypothetical protein KKA47_04700 [bacterium]|nr:hypothetical protein [bacterium]
MFIGGETKPTEDTNPCIGMKYYYNFPDKTVVYVPSTKNGQQACLVYNTPGGWYPIAEVNGDKYTSVVKTKGRGDKITPVYKDNKVQITDPNSPCIKEYGLIRTLFSELQDLQTMFLYPVKIPEEKASACESDLAIQTYGGSLRETAVEKEGTLDKLIDEEMKKRWPTDEIFKAKGATEAPALTYFRKKMETLLGKKQITRFTYVIISSNKGGKSTYRLSIIVPPPSDQNYLGEEGIFNIIINPEKMNDITSDAWYTIIAQAPDNNAQTSIVEIMIERGFICTAYEIFGKLQETAFNVDPEKTAKCVLNGAPPKKPGKRREPEKKVYLQSRP